MKLIRQASAVSSQTLEIAGFAVVAGLAGALLGTLVSMLFHAKALAPATFASIAVVCAVLFLSTALDPRNRATAGTGDNRGATPMSTQAASTPPSKARAVPSRPRSSAVVIAPPSSSVPPPVQPTPTATPTPVVGVDLGTALYGSNEPAEIIGTPMSSADPFDWHPGQLSINGAQSPDGWTLSCSLFCGKADTVTVDVNLGRKYTRFVADVGVLDSSDSSGPITIKFIDKDRNVLIDSASYTKAT